MKIIQYWLFPLVLLNSQGLIAEVVTDGSLGGGVQALTGPHYFINSTLGETRGSNLFHSFSAFNIHQGESANFQSFYNIQNIFARVTGGNVSLIDGEILGAGSANLWLINPAGWMVGIHAAINLPGAFHLSTATGIDFKDGGQFLAEPNSQSTLSIAPPIDYQFQNDNQPTITIDQANLTMKPGTDISLVGGNIALKDAHITAPGGRILLGSNAGNQGKWQLDGRGLTQVSGQQGTITIEHGQFDGRHPSLSLNALIKNTDNGGGEIQLVANHINLTNALLSALSTQNARQRGGNILLQGETIQLAHSTITTDVDVLGSQAGGDIKLSGKNVLLTGLTDNAEFGSLLSADTRDLSTGKAGAIAINLSGELHLTTQSGLTSIAGGDGASGIITINAPNINLDDNSSVRVLANAGNGDAGAINITSLDLTLRQGSFLESTTKTFGNAGNINITSPHITIDGSEITATSAAQSNGTAGNITINANSTAEAGIARDTFVLLQQGKITTGNNKLAEGNGGNIVISTGTLAMNGGYIQANTLGKNGIGGTVTVNTERVLVSHEQLTIGGERQASVQRPTLNLIQAAAPNGESGQVNVTSVELNIAGQLAKVDAGFANNRQIASDPCSVQRGEATSSLVQGGNGSLPPNARDAVSLPLLRHIKTQPSDNTDIPLGDALQSSSLSCGKDKR